MLGVTWRLVAAVALWHAAVAAAPPEPQCGAVCALAPRHTLCSLCHRLHQLRRAKRMSMFRMRPHTDLSLLNGINLPFELLLRDERRQQAAGARAARGPDANKRFLGIPTIIPPAPPRSVVGARCSGECAGVHALGAITPACAKCLVKASGGAGPRQGKRELLRVGMVAGAGPHRAGHARFLGLPMVYKNGRAGGGGGGNRRPNSDARLAADGLMVMMGSGIGKRSAGGGGAPRGFTKSCRRMCTLAGRRAECHLCLGMLSNWSLLKGHAKPW